MQGNTFSYFIVVTVMPFQGIPKIYVRNINDEKIYIFTAKNKASIHRAMKDIIILSRCDTQTTFMSVEVNPACIQS